MNPYSMKKIIISILLITSLKLSAANGLWIGAGTVTHNFLSAQTGKTDGKKTIDLYPTVLIGGLLPGFFSGISLAPGIGYAKSLNSKDKTSKNEIILQYHLAQNIFNGVQIRYGFSTFITKISGDGGTTELNNGNSTSTFYVPENSSTSYTSSLDLGGEAFMLHSTSLRLQFSITKFLSSEQRKVSNLVTVNYYF